MAISANQLNLCDISTDFDKFYNQNQENLLYLLNQFIDIRGFIPFSFYRDYYSHFSRERDFSLESMLNAFILKNIVSIPTIDLLIFFLRNSADIRKFYGFSTIPHKSQFSRFKINFLDDLNNLFNNLVGITEDLSNEVNPFLSSILISDTTGFEPYVAENTPKFYQSQLRKAKAYAKRLAKDNSNSSFDAEKYAQSQMPKAASPNPDAKLAYLNGHFGYYQKCILSTNALGIVRNINFYDTDNNLDLDLTPQDIKNQFDSKSLILSLETFFQLHPTFSYKYFLGDSGFDADDNYAYLHRKNIMPIISLNPRNTRNLPQPDFNEVGVPLSLLILL